LAYRNNWADLVCVIVPWQLFPGTDNMDMWMDGTMDNAMRLQIVQDMKLEASEGGKDPSSWADEGAEDNHSSFLDKLRAGGGTAQRKSSI